MQAVCAILLVANGLFFEVNSGLPKMNSLRWILEDIRCAGRQALGWRLKLFGRVSGMNCLPYRQNVTYTMHALVVAPPKFKSVLVFLTL